MKKPKCRSDCPETILPGQKPSNLKDDPLIGTFLGRFQDEVIKKHEDFGSPWMSLSCLPNVTDEEKRFLEAGQSVSVAAKRLLNASIGAAKLKSSDPEELHSEEKVFGAQYKHGFYSLDHLTPNDICGECQLTLNEFRAGEDAKISKRDGSGWMPQPLPTAGDLAERYPVELFMIWHWLRWGYGEFGLCFYTDEALAKLMTILFEGGLHHDRLRRYRDIRDDWGLKHWNTSKPFVTDARQVDTGLIEITYRKSPNGKWLRWNLGGADRPIVMGNRQIYPVLE
jgi:hypothetical protein